MCDGIDNDCDGEIDVDPVDCEVANGTAACVDLACGIAECDEGWYDLDNQYATGCEVAAVADGAGEAAAPLSSCPPLADAHAALHEASWPQLPGFGLYWDYVHFTADGAEVVAAEIAEVIEREGLLESPRGSPAGERDQSQTMVPAMAP